MANADNKCADLEVKDFHADAEDTLGLIYNKQVELQKRLGFDFTDWTLKEIAEAESLSVGYIHRICNPDKAWVYNENHLNHQAEKRKAAAP